MKNKLRGILCLMLVVFCMTSFSLTAFASGDDFSSSEDTSESTDKNVDDVVNSDAESEDEDSEESEDSEEEEESNPLTPEGNLTLIDDILQSETGKYDIPPTKQFITFQSKNGNYFYLVIDRSGETENVYFLNLVDESDLMALIEVEEEEAPVITCVCAEKCVIGSIHTGCEICRTNMSECTGKEPLIEETPDLTPPVVEDEPDSEDGTNGIMILAALVVLVIGGCIALLFKMKNTKPKTSGDSDLDDYDYGQDDEDEPDEIEFDDADLMAESNHTMKKGD